MKKYFEEPIVEIEKFMTETVMAVQNESGLDEDWTEIG